MLVFHSGIWHDVPVAFSDPIFTEGHHREAASMIAERVAKGACFADATAFAEKSLYLRLYPQLVVRKEHGAPQN